MDPLDKSDPFSPTSEELETARKMIAACAGKEGKRSLDDERVFMENLLVQRLNFLLVVFAIFVAAGFTSKGIWLSGGIFLVGACTCYLMAKIVYRAHVKHHWIMRLFYSQETPNREADGPEEKLPHPITFINNAMKKPERQRLSKGSVSTLVGSRVPMLCCWFLLLCGIVSIIAAITSIE